MRPRLLSERVRSSPTTSQMPRVRLRISGVRMDYRALSSLTDKELRLKAFDLLHGDWRRAATRGSRKPRGLERHRQSHGAEIGRCRGGDSVSHQPSPAGPMERPVSPRARCGEAPDYGLFYQGSSMLGTFRPGDRLAVVPMSIADLRAGDVIVFRGLGGQNEPDRIVHRVVATATDGLVTRGDNAPAADEHLLGAENLLGRVTHFERGGPWRPVRGGWLGLLRARALHTRRPVRRLIARASRKPYGWLCRSGLIRRFWRPTISRMQLCTDRGPVVKYVVGGRTVARWWPAKGRFECRKPYDLLISRPADGSTTESRRDVDVMTTS